MDKTVLVGVIVVVVLVAAGIAIWAYLRQRSQRLHERFGPEYDRTIREMGGRRKAEIALERREKRVERYHIRPLAPSDQTRFSEQWRQVQSQFVDNPQLAVAEADTLVGELMSVRGYPVADFEQRAADVSVAHPVVVEHYRAAHDIALQHRRGEASTEDLRRAMVHYRTLFDELADLREVNPTEVQR
jgi:hypothetical protein